jgi:hypothetical protein
MWIVYVKVVSVIHNIRQWLINVCFLIMDVRLCALSQLSGTVAHKPIVLVASSSNDNYPGDVWPYVI